MGFAGQKLSQDLAALGLRDKRSPVAETLCELGGKVLCTDRLRIRCCGKRGARKAQQDENNQAAEAKVWKDPFHTFKQGERRPRIRLPWESIIAPAGAEHHPEGKTM